MSDIKTEFMLKGVRLSFPDLYKHSVFKGKSTGKFGATFILDEVKHAAVIKELKTSAAAMIKGELKGKKPDSKYLCLKTNASYETERPEYENALMVKAMNARRPTLIDSGMNPVVEEDNVFYSGCYVNVKISLWAKLKTAGGPSLGANLITVQFARDGEAFDGSYISEEDAIADFEEMAPGEGFDTVADESGTDEEDDLFGDL